MAKLSQMLPAFRSELQEITKVAYEDYEQREERRQREALARARGRVRLTEPGTQSRLRAEKGVQEAHANHGGGYAAGLAAGIGLAKPVHDLQGPLGQFGTMASGVVLDKMERGNVTTPEQAAALGKHMSPNTVLHHVPQGGLGRAHHAAWNRINHLPGVEPHFEEYARREGIDPSKWGAGLQHGTAVIPGQGGPHIAAHEFGHAANSRSKWGDLYHKHLSKREDALAKYGPLAAMGGATVAPTYSKMESAMPILGGLAVAPKLIEEGMASVRGIRAMKQLGYGSKDLWKARGSLGAAFGTYAAPRIIGGVGGPLAVTALKRYADRSRDRRGLPSRAGYLRQGEKIKQLEEQMGMGANVER